MLKKITKKIKKWIRGLVKLGSEIIGIFTRHMKSQWDEWDRQFEKEEKKKRGKK